MTPTAENRLPPILAFAKRVKRALRAFWTRFQARREARQAFRYDRRQFMDNAGALHLDRKAAACAEIVMGYHVLEKGLTMPRRRLGFGTGTVVRLMELVESFERSFGADPQVTHAVGVLRTYRELHRDHPDPMPRLDAFLAKHPDVPAAIEPHVRREDFFAAKDAPFPAFAASQGGTRGFGQDADKVLVVTTDLSSVRWSWERHDCYVNGGIFVMNLCYALHWHGVAHCILHWSVPPAADRAAHDLLGIPANEAIVQVLACGTPPEEFDVAASPRRSIDEILTWHGRGEG